MPRGSSVRISARPQGSVRFRGDQYFGRGQKTMLTVRDATARSGPTLNDA